MECDNPNCNYSMQVGDVYYVHDAGFVYCEPCYCKNVEYAREPQFYWPKKWQAYQDFLEMMEYKNDLDIELD